jgi:hypothetical protein
MRIQQRGTHSTHPETETAEGERSEDMEGKWLERKE